MTRKISAALWTLAASALVVVVSLVAVGCGSDSGDNTPAATVTPAPSFTAAPTATATPLPSAAGVEDLFGSAAQGSGALTIVPLAEVPAYFSACLGGSGPNCVGGNVVYIGSDPGFKEADADEPDVPLFALPDGVTVSLQVIAIDPAVTLKFESGDQPSAGQSVLLGTTPGIHADLEWQLVLAGGAPLGAGHPVTLKLTTTANGYSDSAEFTVTVRASSGTAPSESGD